MKKHCTLFLVVLVLMIALLVIPAFAIQSGLTMHPMDKAEIERINQKRNVEIYQEPILRAISCFDVSEEGKMALGYATSLSNNYAKISVFDREFNFLYGIQFKIRGSYYISWSGEDLLIYTVRNDIAAVYDANGTCLEMMKCDISAENDAYVRKVLASKKRTAGAYTYELKNNFGLLDLFTTSYSYLMRTDAFGNNEVLYNANSEYLPRLILSILFIKIICVFGIWFTVKRFEQMKKEKEI
mgnify:CR=1 FL=1